MQNQNALKMQEGDTLAYNLSGESVRGLWAQIDQTAAVFVRRARECDLLLRLGPHAQVGTPTECRWENPPGIQVGSHMDKPGL